ncbi:glycosyl hydrolase 108 family protein [Gluconobacter japonicus]|uniref:glycosyl hydrolase 108 family protein n=1 Tax=Gluconobacter japonicus TaxID=376620 RepID=UPI003D26FE16
MDFNFDIAAQFTASREGLYQCLHSDAGNWTFGAVGQGNLVGTMRGISAPVMVRWLGDASMVTKSVMQSITQDQFNAIARCLYWRAINGDQLPAGLDLLLFDFAFNSGVARAAKQLQRVLCMQPDEIDGDIGELTLEAVLHAPVQEITLALSDRYKRRLQDDLGVTSDGIIGPGTLKAIKAQDARTRALVYACASLQDASYRSFKGFAQFGRGWLGRLDQRVEAAVSLLTSVPALT